VPKSKSFRMSPNCIVHLLGVIALNLMVGTYVADCVSFNTNGFQRCIFNVAVNDALSATFSRDVLDDLLVRTSGKQLWTIFRLNEKRPTDESYDEMSLDRPRFWRESCSVNFVVSVGPKCFKRSLRSIFGPRQLLIENTFIMILESGVLNKCTFEQIHGNIFDGWPTVVDIYTVFISKLNVPESTYSFCSFCSKKYQHSMLPTEIDYQSIQELRKFSASVKSKSVLPIIAAMTYDTLTGHSCSPSDIKPCAFLYRIRKTTQPDKIGCSNDNIFIENAAARLNVSIEFPTIQESYKNNQFLYDVSKHFSASVYLRTFGVFILWRKSTSSYSQLIPKDQILRFVYCVKQEEWESFNALFWTTPMDTWSWVGLSISCVALTLQLRGEWFQVYSILMRQSCTVLLRNRTLLIFIFVTIVFTYGYESFISSSLIVPTPFKTFKSLKELIDNGYKIIGSQDNHPKPQLREIFKRENISVTMESALVKGSKHWSDIQNMLSISTCKTTGGIDEERSDYIILYYEKSLPGIKCFPVRDTAIFLKNLYFFFGHLEHQLYEIGRKWKEAGILDMYYRFYIFINELAVRKLRKLESQRKNILISVPFGLRDEKIMSIFIGLAILLLISLLVFVFEIILKLRNTVKKFVGSCKRNIIGVICCKSTIT